MKKVKRVLCAALAAVQAASLITFSAAAKDEFIRTDTIAVGDNHSLVIKSDLSLWAAGDNSHGQLGAGTSVDNTHGVKVMDNVVAVDANGETSFAIDTNGCLYGWGDNTSGQIEPLRIAQYIFTPIKIMDNVVAVSAGDGHTVAITADGTAYGWGSNKDGELGFAVNSGNNTQRKLMEDIVDIAAGDDFTMLVTENGRLYFSGDNSNGQFGTSNYRSCDIFTSSSLDNVAAVEAGSDHALALLENGSVYGAGLNDNKQICEDSKTRINTFTKLNLNGVESIFAGADSSAAVNSNGNLYVWGNNDYGQFQNGNTYEYDQPTLSASDVISIAFSDNHSLILKKDGSVSAAGEGKCGELFYFADNAVIKPERILENVLMYSAGADHAAAIVDGVLYTWGNNDCGQLGHGNYIARSEPTKVELPSAPIKVWCGNKCTFVQTKDLRVFVFGDNSGNMLGISTKADFITEPTSNVLLADYQDIEIACGDGFCVALLDGEVFGWGINMSGRLCDLPKNVDSPMLISDKLTDIVDVAAGDSHVLALDEDGFVWGWGANGSKQIGTRDEKVYTEVPEIIDIVNAKTGDYATIRGIDAAGSHSIALGDDGKVWVWGANAYGQLGFDRYRIAEPIYVAYSGNAVVAGKYACAIIEESEKLLLSGSNRCGALGDGTETDSSVFVKETASSASAVDIGDYFGGYVRGDGVLFCWGDNSVGQVGNGRGGVSIKAQKVISDALCGELVSADGVTLDQTELVIKPNKTVKLTATVTPADTDIKSIRWSSSNIKVATVASDGTVKAVAKGEAVITATTANGIKAECKVTVTIPVSSFSVSPSKSKTLNIGQSFTFKAKTYPSTAIDKTLLYESSDPSVAKVSAKGKVTAVSAGTATITVTAKSNPEKTRTVTINVRPAKTKFSSRKATADGVLLKWKAVNGADGYTIYRRTSTKGASTVVADVETGETLTCLDANAKSGKTYYYFIRAYIEVNGKKIYSSSYSLYKIKAK